MNYRKLVLASAVVITLALPLSMLAHEEGTAEEGSGTGAVVVQEQLKERIEQERELLKEKREVEQKALRERLDNAKENLKNRIEDDKERIKERLATTTRSLR